jgi:hypothetical protein
VIVLVVVLVGAFLYFKSGIVNFNIEHMSADGYKGNVDLKRKDAERELAEINNIVNGNIKMSDIEGNIAANQNWKDIKADYNYLTNSLIPAFNKDTDKNKGGSDTLKYIGSATNGAAYIKTLDTSAEAALEKKGWDPINSADSAAMQQVKKLAAN